MSSPATSRFFFLAYAPTDGTSILLPVPAAAIGARQFAVCVQMVVTQDNRNGTDEANLVKVKAP
jgi:hypothetical protein